MLYIWIAWGFLSQLSDDFCTVSGSKNQEKEDRDDL